MKTLRPSAIAQSGAWAFRSLARFRSGSVGIVLGLALALLAGEALFRLLPAVGGLSNPPVSAAVPVVRYRPGANYTYSRGWDMRMVQHGRFNSLGFPDREPPKNQPIVAIIGDSFVEALMIPQGERVSDVLNRTDGGARFASFGIGGANLPDYMLTAVWLRRTLPVRGVVFVVTGEDVVRSLQPKRRGYWYNPRTNGLKLNCACSFGVRNALNRSALAEYVLYNLKFGPGMIKGAFIPSAQANPRSPDSPEGVAIARRFISMAAGLQQSGIDVLVVLDADHQAVYRGRPGKQADMALLSRIAKEMNVRTLDLTVPFTTGYRARGERFDFGSVDAHWNMYGHRLVAGAIADALRKPPRT